MWAVLVLLVLVGGTTPHVYSAAASRSSSKGDGSGGAAVPVGSVASARGAKAVMRAAIRTGALEKKTIKLTKWDAGRGAGLRAARAIDHAGDVVFTLPLAVAAVSIEQLQTAPDGWPPAQPEHIGIMREAMGLGRLPAGASVQAALDKRLHMPVAAVLLLCLKYGLRAPPPPAVISADRRRRQEEKQKQQQNAQEHGEKQKQQQNAQEHGENEDESAFVYRFEPLWDAYIRTLPHRIDVPVLWPAEDREWLAGTHAAAVAQEEEALMPKEYSMLNEGMLPLLRLHCQTHLDTDMDMDNEYMDGMGGMGGGELAMRPCAFDQASYAWARQVVRTRLIGPALWPIADLANHAAVPSLSLHEEDGLLVARARRAVRRGEELSISYGNHTAGAMLGQFGFMTGKDHDGIHDGGCARRLRALDSPHEAVIVRPPQRDATSSSSSSSTVKASDGRAALLQRLGHEPRPVLSFHAAGSIPARTMQAARVLALTANEVEAVLDGGGLAAAVPWGRKPASSGNEHRARAYLTAVITARLATYKAHQAPPPPPPPSVNGIASTARRRLAVRLVHLERCILRGALDVLAAGNKEEL